MRRAGLIFLACAMVMLLLGQTVLEPYLGRRLLFVIYWLVCFGFTALAMLTALVDVWVVRSRARERQTDLIKGAVQSDRARVSDEEG